MNWVGRFISNRYAASASALTKRIRFYKEVNVVNSMSEGKQIFNVALDNRILKTQGGHILKIDNEPLAMAIAEEWSSQGEYLNIGHMRLTGLAFTAQDNPLCMTRESIVSKVMEYLSGDTVLFWNSESDKLYRYQERYWGPIISHANKNLGMSLKPCETLLNNDVISPLDHRTIEKWLLSHNFCALIGLQYAVEAVKSVLIPYSVLSFNLTATEAVHCAALEQKMQAETWGTVEWAHNVEEAELTARLSAALLFVYFSMSKSTNFLV